MILTEQPKYWFYPDFMNNLKLPEAQQLAVEIIRPTGFQTKEMTTVTSTREFYPDDQPVDAKGNSRDVAKFKNISVEVKINADYILRTCVGKIRNLEVAPDAEGAKSRKIETGSELAECRAYGISELIDMICTEVKSDIPTEAKKKIIE